MYIGEKKTLKNLNVGQHMLILTASLIIGL